MKILLIGALTAYIGSSLLTVHTYIKSLLNDGSAPDCRSKKLYRILTLTTQTYMDLLLNDVSTHDSRSNSLHGDSLKMDGSYS